ncbi:hypothetical protein BDZ91DRAFT_666739, partial [Kalaharituber pfeilii]
LAQLMPEYIQWSTEAERNQKHHDIFSLCIGFLDGSNIILRDKPKNDPEAYFLQKKNYRFNLQAICNWEGRFIWV